MCWDGECSCYLEDRVPFTRHCCHRGQHWQKWTNISMPLITNPGWRQSTHRLMGERKLIWEASRSLLFPLMCGAIPLEVCIYYKQLRPLSHSGRKESAPLLSLRNSCLFRSLSLSLSLSPLKLPSTWPWSNLDKHKLLGSQTDAICTFIRNRMV